MRRPRRYWLLAAVLAACPAVAQAPAWLDTTPPRVKVEPAARWHNRVVAVSFSASEYATIYVSRNSATAFQTYRIPMAVSDEGRTALYYYGIDDYGNRSATDSVVYMLDRRSPELTVTPAPGLCLPGQEVRVSASEPCRLLLLSGPSDSAGLPLTQPLRVEDSLVCTIAAVDSAGNRVVKGPLRWAAARARVSLSASPAPGTYNAPVRVSLTATPAAKVYVTLDPQAASDAFDIYRGPLALPQGSTLLRWYAVDARGARTGVSQAVYEVDTVPPALHILYSAGMVVDTIALVARGAERVYYTTADAMPDERSARYGQPLLIRREGVGRVRAFAVDAAGNRSPVTVWQMKYDRTPPQLTLSSSGGVFNRGVRVTARTSEPAVVLYTLDGGLPQASGLLYRDGITIAAQGRTTLRAVAQDEAGNLSAEQTAVFTVDTVAPTVRARIDVLAAQQVYLVSLSADEPADIYYASGGADPGASSARYEQPLRLGGGELLRYFAIDRAGNRGPVQTMDDLRRPMATAQPGPGAYNHPLAVSFLTTVPVSVRWRLLPDSAFAAYTDTIRIDADGQYALEYYCELAGGPGPLKRHEYRVDLSAPRVRVTLRKGIGDTSFVLFDSRKNVTIYYTLDGSNPLSSPTVRTCGNKLLRSSDRVQVLRRPDTRLAYYAEDAAGNRSHVAAMDLFRPRSVPSLPDGADIVYDRVLSLELNTAEGGRIHYSRHGRVPSADSAVYARPITIGRSDTICAFAVDASGVAGEVDTFVYLVDLPPQARFVTVPGGDSLGAGAPVTFDASASSDAETPRSGLQFRWDFQGDGVFDTRADFASAATFTYPQPGVYRPVLEVLDGGRRTGSCSRELLVRGRCPSDMRSVVGADGHAFCIDRFEWPGKPRTRPTGGLSWVEAKMACLDGGKRLCSAAEWQAACSGTRRQPYPYGTDYDRKRCPTEGKRPYAAGSFPDCGEGFGLADMVGNLWEWVEDKRGDAPLQAGGSYRLGALAHCGLTAEGTVSTRSPDVGLRCCR